jgi:CRP-like cAMP-binding protein
VCSSDLDRLPIILALPLCNTDLRRMSNDTIDFSLLIGPQIPSRNFKAGDTIFKQGEPATELYVVKNGRVGIQLGNRILDTLDSYDIFGEMALIDQAPRSADAIAVTDVTLIPVSEKQFLFLVSQTPFFALKVMRVLARRLRAANKVI